MGAGTPVKQCAYPLASSELGCAVDGEGCSGSSGRQARPHRRTLCARGMDCKKHQPSPRDGCRVRPTSSEPPPSPQALRSTNRRTSSLSQASKHCLPVARLRHKAHVTVA